ncbi:hypothetical protein AB4Z52_13925 [Rhizobium sp. 2YAF20]|uniref:hypothetical protein n=1 Tax=Rhizobium sp. 2YAF20 TaxID=3233027 RepID=UPI003F9A0082
MSHLLEGITFEACKLTLEDTDMLNTLLTTAAVLTPVAFNGAPARSAGGDTIAVTPDNFPGAESDLYFGNIARMTASASSSTTAN